jgi:hypothetical protein
MKELLLIHILFLSHCALNQEEYSFTLYFEDAVGNKDSLILGYDENGTQLLDEQFGEVDISNEPWDSVFEVRTSENIIPNPSSTNTPIYFSKKQIIDKDCSNYNETFSSFEGMQFNLLFNIKAVHFPIVLSWDSEAFSDSCNFGTALYWGHEFSSWEWGCCPVFMSSLADNENIEDLVENELTLEQIDFANSYIMDNDTVYTYRLSFSHYYEIPILNSNEFIKNQLVIFPNPVFDLLNIETIEDLNKVEILNTQGEIVFQKNTKGINAIKIDLKTFDQGVYILKLIWNNGFESNSTIIKR